jgi:hypothetical protein
MPCIYRTRANIGLHPSFKQLDLLSLGGEAVSSEARQMIELFAFRATRRRHATFGTVLELECLWSKVNLLTGPRGKGSDRVV